MIEIVLLGLACLMVALLIGMVHATGRRNGLLQQRVDELHALLAALGNNAAAVKGALDMAQLATEQRLQSLSQSTGGALEAVRTAVDQKLGQALGEARDGRTELGDGFRAFEKRLEERFQAIAHASAGHAEQLRGTLNERLTAIQQDNASKLEEMRKTVDEKLQTTLEQRLGQSFKQVSDNLEQVHRGLGEMQNLAASVGDLKRVFANVKTRGTWGEVQLEAMIAQILTPDQYQRNVATRPGASERVEIAIRLPGREINEPVWLPIDAKFPIEDYQRLLEAHERADGAEVELAARALEQRIRAEARTIREKYVEPPHTTDFAIMYLPSEGLYAEVLRRVGLSEAIQRDFRVVLSGPTNLAAMLNSLQMGFRTLAIEKRTSEVWNLLGSVKTEFGKFGEAIAATQKKIEAASNQFGDISVRSRAIERKLREVEAVPLAGEAVLVPLLAPEDDEEPG